MLATYACSQRIAPSIGRADIARMDAPNPSAAPTFASRTPLHIGAVKLKTRNLEALAAFYGEALGLSIMGRDEGCAALGAGGMPLVQLEAQPAARPDDPREAGLYHTAFLMPT